MVMCYFFIKTGFILFLPITLLLCGCASAPDQNTTFSDASIAPRRNAPLTQQEYQRTNLNFSNQLPLGIGGRFDLFVSDTASDVNEFYNSYLRPVRQGKIFAKSAYVVDYTILPSRGETFDNQNGEFRQLKDVSVRSDYKLQIGMSRRFNHFGDFLKPEFWMASGKHAPTEPEPQEMPEPLILTIGEEDYQAGEGMIEPTEGLLSAEALP